MIITADFSSGHRTVYTASVYQFDKGLRLKFVGIALPEEFEVHFSNQREGGTATVVKGKNSFVRIPDAFLMQGDYLYAWIYSYVIKSWGIEHDVENEIVEYDPDHNNYDPEKAATSYQAIIPVVCRPAPIVLSGEAPDQPPTEGDGIFDYTIKDENLNIY